MTKKYIVSVANDESVPNYAQHLKGQNCEVTGIHYLANRVIRYVLAEYFEDSDRRMWLDSAFIIDKNKQTVV